MSGSSGEVEEIVRWLRAAEDGRTRLLISALVLGVAAFVGLRAMAGGNHVYAIYCAAIAVISLVQGMLAWRHVARSRRDDRQPL